LKRAREDLTAIIAMEPETPEWRERRAQVLVDMKLFEEAIADYDEAERMYRAMYDDATTTYKSLGMLSNRALAYEGLSRWDAAIADYSEALKYSSMMGATPPYVLNSRGNCYNSIGEYEKALDDYSRAAGIFQQSRNLSGAIYAQSNAALMLAELGRIDEAIEDMEKVKRRAAGSVDMRAALAALYWSRGEEQRAEDNWNWSCTAINSGQMVEGGPVLDGCELYRDYDWLGRIRRWPPSMVQKFKRFIELS
jgi:tetratricopeptide (TPR) repeat protein